MTQAPQAPAPDERIDLGSKAGRLSLRVAGQGPPLLLVHSVNAAASTAEVEPLIQHFSRTRTVCAMDLPGYGLSDRSVRPYTPRLMTDALHAALAWLQARSDGAAVDVMALSLSCEFAARAAVEQPGSVRSLALVSPTGFNGRKAWRGPAGSTRFVPWVHAALTRPGWGAALFRGLTRPGVVHYFLRRTFGAPVIDDDLWAACVATARQPGAEHAPLYFLSAAMFSADIHTVYEQLACPVWMSHGVRGDFTDYRQKRLVLQRPNWRFETYPTGAMPYFEVPERFCADYERFLATV